jgi:hypothetical protein
MGSDFGNDFGNDFVAVAPLPTVGTGPPYPVPAGSELVGPFVVTGGVSVFNPWATVISQYSNSPILDAMITAFNAAMDQTQNITNFYDMIWNVNTAQGYGLDVWGRIVGVTRNIVTQATGSGTYFGFEEAGTSWTGFGPGSSQGGFFGAENVITSVTTLQDSDFRTLILAKAASNIWDGSIPGVNAILLALFPGRGKTYVMDNQNMSMSYIFTFALTIPEQAIVQHGGVLPQPAGVLITVQIIPPLFLTTRTTLALIGKNRAAGVIALQTKGVVTVRSNRPTRFLTALTSVALQLKNLPKGIVSLVAKGVVAAQAKNQSNLVAMIARGFIKLFGQL